MKLTIEQIKTLATGVVRAEQEDGKIRLCRFTKEQEELYKKVSAEKNRNFYDRSLSSAGIRLWFKTDSESFEIKFDAKASTSRKYFSFDVFVNGKPFDYIDNFSNVTLPNSYTEVELPLGSFEKKVLLGSGIKEVCIFFPYTVCPLIEEISLDDGAFAEAVKPVKKLLAFGDSITHGYDALRPSNRYASCLADQLGAEEINKGIGGEVFFPELAKTRDDFSPDYITVAYGTNDWNSTSEDTFKVNCKEFFINLCRNYPDSKIFAITPIWRKNYMDEKEFGPFENVEKDIIVAVSGMKNVTVVSGFDFVPKDESYFADLRLHPNDKGFEHYSKNLFDAIKNIIQ